MIPTRTRNLSHRFVQTLADLFAGSQHVRLLGLEEADDRAIWEHAKEHGFVIVTQDSDFPDWNKILGSPPEIIWLRCGNATVAQVETKLRQAAQRIRTLETDPEVEIVEVW